jgi:DNA-binding PadR family transcriptional regulator
VKVSILNLHCLNALSDDREDLSSIVADVRRSTHSDVTPQDVATCLNDLVAEEMASRTADAAGVEWYELTPQGRRELDAHWVDE